MEEILVIDIGGTKTNISIVSSDDQEIIIQSSNIIQTNSNPEITIEKIHSAIYSGSKKNDLSCLSLSLPGLWDKNGVLKESNFLKNWIDYPFIIKLQDQLKIKDVIWESDVICGALGEYNSPVETHGPASLLYINLGTGIGAAFIDNEGKVFKSKSNLTLRMQKLVYPFEDELTSGVSLICGGSLTEISKYKTIENLFNDYRAGKIEAFDLISKAQLELAAWLINLFYLFAPDIIVLNGGLTYGWEVLCEEAIAIANEELNNQVKILPSKLKEMAPIYGGYLNFMRHPEHQQRVS